MLRVIHAEYLDYSQIQLIFNDGTSGIVDLQGKRDGPIFQLLNYLDFFRQFELTNHTLTWPNGADFAPEYLHELVLKAEETSQICGAR